MVLKPKAMPKLPNQCVYCSAISNTRDHIPPKCLLEKPYPANLWVVPACANCNQSYALDEEYLLLLLTQISTSPMLTAKLAEGGQIDRALSGSLGLESRLLDALSVTDDGRVEVKPERARILRVVQKIAFGIYIAHYRIVPDLVEIIAAAAFPCDLEDPRRRLLEALSHTTSLARKKWFHVQKGVFSYSVIRDGMSNKALYLLIDFHETLWGVAKIPDPVDARDHARRTRSRSGKGLLGAAS